MKLKELVKKNVILHVIIENPFDETDIENVGEDYEVSQEQIETRIQDRINDDRVTISDCISYEIVDE